MAVSNRVGPYLVLRPLGAGGMAETFVAERRGPGDFVQRVCLKRIRSDLAHDPELVRQFMAEAAIAARLRNAAIAQLLDFGEADGQLYLAMELIEGLDLRQLLKQHPSGVPAALVQHIAIELCTALDVAHASQGAPVVHRDVSPSNVLISTEGEVKLADFGIARSLDTPSHTRTGIVRGKVPYMAPEYARTGRYDARADLFSLGTLLYECACGARPHDGLTDLETLERSSRGDRKPLAERAPTLPEALAAIIEQLLEAEPELRFSSASAVLDALTSLPSDGRTRRELGALVVECQRRNAAPAPAAATASSASVSVSARAPTDLASNLTPHTVTQTLGDAAPALPLRRSGPRIALFAALLAAVAALAVALTRPSATPPHTPTPAAAPAPASDAPKLAAQPPQPQPLPPDPQVVVRPIGDAGAAQAASNARAKVDVFVVPYGEIFIDDVRIGTSPSSATLAPGAHRIRAVTPTGVLRKQVVLRAGQHERIRLQ